MRLDGEADPRFSDPKRVFYNRCTVDLVDLVPCSETHLVFLATVD